MSEIAEQKQKRINKSEIARSILKDIGALTKNPPEGWRKTVEDRLHEQNLSMKVTSIYQVRQKAMAKAKAKRAKKIEDGSSPKRGRPSSSIDPMTALTKVVSLANEIGGINKLEKLIQTMKTLKSLKF